MGRATAVYPARQALTASSYGRNIVAAHVSVAKVVANKVPAVKLLRGRLRRCALGARERGAPCVLSATCLHVRRVVACERCASGARGLPGLDQLEVRWALLARAPGNAAVWDIAVLGAFVAVASLRVVAEPLVAIVNEKVCIEEANSTPDACARCGAALLLVAPDVVADDTIRTRSHRKILGAMRG